MTPLTVGSARERLYCPERLAEAAAIRCQSTAAATHHINFAALSTICTAFEEASSEQTTVGRFQAQAILMDSIAKRLRLSEYLSQYPEIPNEVVPNPIFIISPFRTGSTFLHRLLAQDPDNRFPRLWEVAYPPPAASDSIAKERYLSEDPRVARAEAALRLLHRANPNLATVHPTGCHLAEECFGLLETSLMSHSFMFYADVPTYLAWLDACDDAEWSSAYEIYAAQLKLLHWSYAGPRWILKSPVHLWNLDALFAVFPAARVIQLHRDAVDVMASFCNLLLVHRQMVSKRPSLTGIGQQGLAYTKEAIRRGVLARHRLDASRFIDVNFTDLVNQPLSSIRAIYGWLGIELGHEAVGNMSSWLSRDHEASREKAGIKKFNLKQDEVRSTFEAYSALADSNA